MEVAVFAFLVVGVMMVRSGLLLVVSDGNAMPLVAGLVLVTVSVVLVVGLIIRAVQN